MSIRTCAQQVIKQMNKLINVLQATDLTESPAVIRELVLVRVRTAQEIAHRGPEGSRDLRRARGGFLHRRLRHRSHRRPRKAGRIHRRDAQLRRNRSHPLRRVAISLEAKKLRLQPPVPTKAGRVAGKTPRAVPI